MCARVHKCSPAPCFTLCGCVRWWRRLFCQLHNIKSHFCPSFFLPQLIFSLLITLHADLLLILRPPSLMAFLIFTSPPHSVVALLKSWMILFDFFSLHFILILITQKGYCECKGAMATQAAQRQRRLQPSDTMDFLRWMQVEGQALGTKLGWSRLSFITINRPRVHRYACPPFHPSSIPLSALRPFINSILQSFHLSDTASLSLHPYLSLPFVYSLVRVAHFSVPSTLCSAMFFFRCTRLFFHAAGQEAIQPLRTQAVSLMRNLINT